MPKGQQRAIARINQSSIKTLTIPITSTPATFSGVTPVGSSNGKTLTMSVGAPGFATAVIAGLPKGNVLILEAFANLKFDATGAGANISDTFTGNFSIGTTATADNVLTTRFNDEATEGVIGETFKVAAEIAVDGTILASVVDNSDGVSGTGTRLVTTGTGVTSSTINTGPAIGLNLNVTITTATAPTAVVVTGYITISYAVTGNY